MADVKLVIKINEDVYTRLFDNGIQDNEIAVDDVCEMARSLRRGIPLPKGHGSLIDISNIDVIELEDSNHIIRHIKGDEVDVYISAPIIIEADAERDKE